MPGCRCRVHPLLRKHAASLGRGLTLIQGLGVSGLSGPGMDGWRSGSAVGGPAAGRTGGRGRGAVLSGWYSASCQEERGPAALASREEGRGPRVFTVGDLPQCYFGFSIFWAVLFLPSRRLCRNRIPPGLLLLFVLGWVPADPLGSWPCPAHFSAFCMSHSGIRPSPWLPGSSGHTGFPPGFLTGGGGVSVCVTGPEAWVVLPGPSPSLRAVCWCGLVFLRSRSFEEGIMLALPHSSIMHSGLAVFKKLPEYSRTGSQIAAENALCFISRKR